MIHPKLALSSAEVENSDEMCSKSVISRLLMIFNTLSCMFSYLKPMFVSLPRNLTPTNDFF